MARTPLWKSIADTLRDEVARGQYRPGDKLPTEAALAARFGVNRHTVRHALKALAEAGLTRSRRGAGVFVAQSPTRYALGRRVRFHQNLRAAGQAADKRSLRCETRAADDRERSALKLRKGAQVHIHEGLSFADGTAISLFRSAFPAARFPALLQRLIETTSVTEALRREGLEDYTRSWTHITAKLATTAQALHLDIREGAALLRTRSVNVDGVGTPVEYGQSWFVGDRVQFTVSPEEPDGQA